MFSVEVNVVLLFYRILNICVKGTLQGEVQYRTSLNITYDKKRIFQ